MGHDTTQSSNDYCLLYYTSYFYEIVLIFFYCLMGCAVEKQVTVKLYFEKELFFFKAWNLTVIALNELFK